VFPVVIDLGRVHLPLIGEVHLALPTYGLLFALGAVVAGVWFLRRARALGVAEEQRHNLAFYSLIAGIVGAKLTLIVLDLPFYIENPGELWGTLRSAGVLLGGVLLGALTFIVYGRRHDLPVLQLGDAVAAPLALAQAIGRLGCHAAGCCWGRVCPVDHPLAVVFRDPLARQQTGVPLNEPLLAIQLVQMFNDAILTLILVWLGRRRIGPPGTVFWIYLLLYSLARGTIEFWRGDLQRGLFFQGVFFDGGISTSQLFCLGGVLMALVMLGRGWSLHGRAADVRRT
jgi:phosphatidylglycerol:prolipoprotein diacylglycerol transferase